MDSKNELQHHGILGMKWGKRNGPPYPLTGAAKARAEKKAAKLRSKLGETEKIVDSQKPSKQKSTQVQSVERRQQVSEYFREKNRQKKEVQKKLAKSPSKVKKMTDDELRAAIARLEMEKKYAELSAPPPKKVSRKDKETMSRGAKLLQDIMFDSTKNIGTQAVTRFMGEQLNTLVSKLFKEYTDEEYVNPKKGQKDK